MDHDSLYETDICAWAEQQAAALRSLASRSDLPNALDLTNVLEEIEDVGRNYIADLSLLIRRILSNAILLAEYPDATQARNWMEEAIEAHADLVQRCQPGARSRIDMATLWQRAIRVAHAGRTHDPIDRTCPTDFDEMCDEGFEIGTAIERIRRFGGALAPV